MLPALRARAGRSVGNVDVGDDLERVIGIGLAELAAEDRDAPLGADFQSSVREWASSSFSSCVFAAVSVIS